ncbi:uncharacterized protein PV09_07969 [Verruconis gallopava]|uniref:N-acetyltransferase domain-containing protein n=1 Tax=Verruconis gallopava TaxID=253628 RepID=A0A0D1XE44_9PEZI|nr:uncharacterized protein PV09_07969 [Verruconis gallopava]KIW00441.1 hypothetical protein PV09_07969 [Verruconis gallopava]
MATTLASISISHHGSHAKEAMNMKTTVKPSTIATAASTPSASVNGNNDGVRVVGIHEYKEAALCLADAFKDDHTTHYFLDTPDSTLTEEEKWDLHVSMMEYITYAHCLKGLVTTVGDFDAVALWLPPGQNIDDLLTIFRSGLWRLKYKLTPEGRVRFFNEFLPLLGESKARVMGDRDNDSWYLVYIGTHSRARGKGCAKKLITHVTDLADAEGKACYLESSNEINPKIYAKYGFEIRRKVWLQRDAKDVVELDLMVREPKTKRNSFLEKESEMRNERL